MTTTETTASTVDQDRLDAFMGGFAADLGAVFHAATVLVGDRLGLYRAMADGTPVTADELAGRTGTDPRMLQEWLSAQAASGYVEYDSSTATFRLPPEQAYALTDENNAVFAPGGLQVAASTIRDIDLAVEAMRTGAGAHWGDHHPDLFQGTERFFRPGYLANLVDVWIPALDGVEARLQAGGTVADVGCGHGASTILLAQAYPASTFLGVDYHDGSIEKARLAAEKAGVADRCRFEVADAASFPGAGYDLVCFFDSFHDLGDPASAARHVRRALGDDGTLMLVEPNAGDRLEDNLNPIGRIFYSVSTTVCVPNSQAQPVGTALGAQAGEATIGAILRDAGFSRVRRATDNPFNQVLEARP